MFGFRHVCDKLYGLMKPEQAMMNGSSNKVLSAPVHLASMAANLETDMTDIKSIWVMQRDDVLVCIPITRICMEYFLCKLWFFKKVV